MSLSDNIVYLHCFVIILFNVQLRTQKLDSLISRNLKNRRFFDCSKMRAGADSEAVGLLEISKRRARIDKFTVTSH